MNYNNSTGQYRDLKKTWTYPGGSAVPDNWNPFPCVKKQSKEVRIVKNNNLLVGAAIGTSDDDLTRAKYLIDSGVDLLVIDTAHGHSEKVLRMLSKVKK